MVGPVRVGPVREGRRNERQHELLVDQIRTSVARRRQCGVGARLVQLLRRLVLIGAAVPVRAAAGRAEEGAAAATAVSVTARDEFGFLVRCCAEREREREETKKRKLELVWG